MTSSVQPTIALAIGFPIARDDLPGLCKRISALLEGSRAALALCDVTGVQADAVAVEALALLQLAARRHGCEIRLLHASAELLELVSFLGLRDVLLEA